MAEFLIRNSLNPNKAIKLIATFNQVIPKGYEGEDMWVVEIATTEPAVSGNAIKPVYLNNVTSRSLDEEITKAVGVIAAQVNWAPLVEDTKPPFVDTVSPSTYEVSIDSSLEINIKEKLPSAGIDASSISLTVNDLDVSDELVITGDPYRYKIKWSPYLRIYDEE